jgi:hypothetical protein
MEQALLVCEAPADSIASIEIATNTFKVAEYPNSYSEESVTFERT